jgi:hypothetical protein
MLLFSLIAIAADPAGQPVPLYLMDWSNKGSSGANGMAKALPLSNKEERAAMEIFIMSNSSLRKVDPNMGSAASCIVRTLSCSFPLAPWNARKA